VIPPSVLGPELPAPPPYLDPLPDPVPDPDLGLFGQDDREPAPPVVEWPPKTPPVRKARRWAVEAGGSWRLRTPDISAWEVGAGLQWGLLLVQVGYQPTVTWDLEGRPLELWGLGAEIGARFELARTSGFYVGATAAARLEWLVLRRADLPRAKDVQIPEAGIAAGLLGGRRIGSLGLELRVEFLLLPTAREIEIPGGPLERLNLLGMRSNLVVYWGASD